MWVTGWVRDRDSGREAAMGETILPGLPGKNGGAPSSLTRPQSPHHTWFFCERDLSNVSVRSTSIAAKTVFLHGPMLALSRVEGTNGQRKDNLMARSKPSARNALKKLREQREELDAQEARLRDEAACELGKVLLECGAETIEPAQLKQLIRASLTIGIGDALKRLSPA